MTQIRPIPVAAVWNSVSGCVSGISSIGGHGLHVAGTIGAAGNNGVGVTGVNWNVAIRPVRVLDVAGVGNNYDIAQGILYAAGLPADDGAGGMVVAPSAAGIINLSLGGPAASTTLEDAIIAAANAGSLIIASAGNAATSDPNYPATYPQTLSVSAVAPDLSLASYSSFGSTVDIAAPGGEMSLGSDFGVLSTIWDFDANAPAFAYSQGTSMAAPHVSGVAALVLAAQPGLSASQVRARLVDYAVPAGPANQYGAGIVNARNSLTQTHAPARASFARLIDAATGGTIATVPAQSNGGYSFIELDDGDYYVYAGQDENGDGMIGAPVRRWGALGGSSSPSLIAVDGADDYPASFDIGIPIESEPNDGIGTANKLAVGGYMIGVISDPSSEPASIRCPPERNREAFTLYFASSGRRARIRCGGHC